MADPHDRLYMNVQSRFFALYMGLRLLFVSYIY